MQAFEETYKREFGFVLEQRSIIVDDLRVRATGKVTLLTVQLPETINKEIEVKEKVVVSLVTSICIMSERVFFFTCPLDDVAISFFV